MKTKVKFMEIRVNSLAIKVKQMRIKVQTLGIKVKSVNKKVRQMGYLKNKLTKAKLVNQVKIKRIQVKLKILAKKDRGRAR